MNQPTASVRGHEIGSLAALAAKTHPRAVPRWAPWVWLVLVWGWGGCPNDSPGVHHTTNGTTSDVMDAGVNDVPPDGSASGDAVGVPGSDAETADGDASASDVPASSDALESDDSGTPDAAPGDTSAADAPTGDSAPGDATAADAPTGDSAPGDATAADAPTGDSATDDTTLDGGAADETDGQGADAADAAPLTELCNGQDDDGDGATDEGCGVYIEPGTFIMGSPSYELGHSDNEELHEVTLTHGFFIDVTEVTQGQWESLFPNNPSKFTTCGPGCPVEQVSWWDALLYANARSNAEGLAPCYTLEGCDGPPGEASVCTQLVVNAPDGDPTACEGYRLPTEAEWEYAYRAGTQTAFYNGPCTQSAVNDPNLDVIGWYDGNSDATPHPVGGKEPNAWGLYDMAGNVSEWCWDWMETFLGTDPVTDPVISNDSSYRVEKGGSWKKYAHYARAASRYYRKPSVRLDGLGFRLVRTAP